MQSRMMRPAQSRTCSRAASTRAFRAQTVPRPAGRSSAVRVRAGMEYDALKGIKVTSAKTGEERELLALWEPRDSNMVVVPFLTHFADLSSWELGQKLIKVMPTLEASSVKVVVVGLGSVANAREFCRVLKFPTENLYCDPDGIAYKALNFSPGFGPEMEISPYAKLLPMLMGIGSPGTLQEVIRGYVGDKGSKPVFEGATPFDILGEGYQRPFELATLRLFNMIGIIPKWAELSPPREDLLTQQGGSVVFSGEETVFRHDDSGILKYTDVDELLRVVLAAEEVSSPSSITIDA